MSEQNKNRVLVEATDRLRELTINELFDQNINATGELARSINYSTQTTERGEAISLSMEDYGFIVESGRGGAAKKGGKSWQPQLIQWIKAKGIRPKPGVTIEQLSYAIYKSINRKGYKAKPFVEPAIRTFITQFPQEYAQAVADDLEIDVNKVTTQ